MSLHAAWIGILYRNEGTMVRMYIISFALLSRCICGVCIVWHWCVCTRYGEDWGNHGKEAAFHFYQIQVRPFTLRGLKKGCMMQVCSNVFNFTCKNLNDITWYITWCYFSERAHVRVLRYPLQHRLLHSWGQGHPYFCETINNKYRLFLICKQWRFLSNISFVHVF